MSRQEGLALPTDRRGLLRQRLKELPRAPGVYRMLDASGQILYVGKAKDLRRRVASYFGRVQSGRLERLVSQIADIAITLTRTEGEALLLEGQLIKSLKPRFNVLLRDDKSYPYILLTTQDTYPRLAFYRGPRRPDGRLFGPYPSAWAVRETLQTLQRLFPVRQCEDGFFRHRTRPCLQYQIGRCSGPCVGLITPERYAQDVVRTVKFLEGRGEEVIAELVEAMEQASAVLEFERAALYRDRIRTLRAILERTAVNGEDSDLDIIACAQAADTWCVQVFHVRRGRHLGNGAFFPKAPPGIDESALLTGFIGQFYADRPVPETLILNTWPEDAEVLFAALSEQAGRAVRGEVAVEGERARWLDLARHNAQFALEQRLNSQTGYAHRLEALRQVLDLSKPLGRIECFDVSHTQGERPVASCVVFDRDGPRPDEYRRFNIEGIIPGDDYTAISQALSRRYQRIARNEYPVPDLILIDGGPGQVAAAEQALCALGFNGIQLVGVSKGPERRPGHERLWLLGHPLPVILRADSPAMHLIDQIRDEAHRFAIMSHRRRRSQARLTSAIEGIKGVGPKRRQRLLKHFGGLRGLERAAVEEIARIAGISQALAQRIHDALHPD
ncbi:excinuclease ABC subunit UvrC [Caldichromatium japonicum]|uniref:UvrABC system protein C n=1 Tax=Caldichromatium japonicum TaxID=2699430 RepID=A0A6G7VCF5_9GAMM|nr:excinuclease ABC subunit UvrC [Caldichromatium japonicum]